MEVHGREALQDSRRAYRRDNRDFLDNRGLCNRCARILHPVRHRVCRHSSVYSSEDTLLQMTATFRLARIVLRSAIYNIRNYEDFIYYQFYFLGLKIN